MAVSSHTVTQTLQALQTLYSNPDPAAKKQANEWLQEFQHSVDAWQVCNDILGSPSSPPEARLFASQTFRTKILYDLKDIPEPQIFPLRDSLIASLSPLVQPSAPSGSRAIRIQICTALADLALQVAAWENPVVEMIEKFGKDPSTVLLLLEFLRTFIEEAMNPHVQITPLVDRVGTAVDPVMSVLIMYIQAQGLTAEVQELVFSTLNQWLRSGDLLASQIVPTPLFSAAFDALASDQLFESAVDVIVGLIHETQEIDENVDSIQAIIPRVVALRSQLEIHQEDPDRIRGYTRIFSEAGECYYNLIARHPADLLPLVEAALACASYPDLDIVPITFEFWYLLSGALGRQSSNPELQPIIEIYQSLQSIIIKHLHFPPDNESQTAQERDEFRAFRHRMGDTLKDCCFVLGAPICLRKSYDMVVEAMQRPNPPWQEIEAPLFSMRSMGAEVDPDDDEVLPRIMDVLPSLPAHPRIQYASILVISRYTGWVDRHPTYIESHLNFISQGFQTGDHDVSAAAAMAMKYMCQDCSQHLQPFLPQLHQFTASAGSHLGQQDLLEIWEALGYVISGMPADQAAPMLRQFIQPVFEQVQAVVIAPVEAQKGDLQKVGDLLEHIDSMLGVVRTLDPVPEPCFETAGPIFAIIDQLLARYGSKYFVSERVGSLLRRGLSFYPTRALEPLLESVLGRMVTSFSETGFACFLWIIGKTAAKFGDSTRGPQGAQAGALLAHAFQRVVEELQKLLQQKSALEIPDVMDDYVHLFYAYITHLPDLTLTSPALHPAVVLTLLALSCPAPETQLLALDILVALSERTNHPQYGPNLIPIFSQCGDEIFSLTIRGVVDTFSEDGWPRASDILNATATVAPPMQVEGWAAKALTGVPGHLLPNTVRQEFLRELHEHLLAPTGDRLRQAVSVLVRSARTARERGRQTRKSLGA